MVWAPFVTLLALALQPLAAPQASRLVAQADVVDGFAASCTGNLDGTGQCVNQETNQRFTCTIIPGQVIDCRSRSGRSFQCVWFSGVQANYAEFWCDSQVDALLRNEISSQQFDRPTLATPLGPGPSGSIFPSNEINPDRFSRDRFKPDDFKPDDPFGNKDTPALQDPAPATPPSEQSPLLPSPLP
jgi:hypothetical protein